MTEQSKDRRDLDRKTLVWVNTTYFAEGLPYMIVRILSSVFFTQIGAKERYIGYLNYLGVPWNLKFFWAPILDGWGRKKHWQAAMQLLVGIQTLGIAVLSYLAASAEDATPYLFGIAILFVTAAFFAATNDIAIDGYYLEALPDRGEQARFSGYRVLSYRLSMVFARSGLVAVAGYLARGLPSGTLPYVPWAYAFAAGAFVLFALALLHLWILPDRTVHIAEPGTSQLQRANRIFRAGFATYLSQPQVGIVLAFIVLYKMGDEIMFSMATPFLMRELGVSAEQYAWIGGIVGALGSIIGAMAGGFYIKRVGLRRALWPLTLAMNLNIGLYIWLAMAKPDPATLSGLGTIAAIHGIEQIAANLGSAALLVFLLTTCSPEFKATHYAIGSAIMSIPGTLVGGQAGVWVEAIGYANLFIIAFVSSIPGMMLIPWVPIRGERDFESRG